MCVCVREMRVEFESRLERDDCNLKGNKNFSDFRPQDTVEPLSSLTRGTRALLQFYFRLRGGLIFGFKFMLRRLSLNLHLLLLLLGPTFSCKMMRLK